MAVHRSGRGPDLVLFHRGMGSWKHWIRNVDSRKVSGGGTLLGDLSEVARRGGRIRLLWGERDDSAFRPATLLIGEIQAAVPGLDLHRIPKAGHWSAYENAPEVNRLLLEFFGGGPEEKRP